MSPEPAVPPSGLTRVIDFQKKVHAGEIGYSSHTVWHCSRNIGYHRRLRQRCLTQSRPKVNFRISPETQDSAPIYRAHFGQTQTHNHPPPAILSFHSCHSRSALSSLAAPGSRVLLYYRCVSWAPLGGTARNTRRLWDDSEAAKRDADIVRGTLIWCSDCAHITPILLRIHNPNPQLHISTPKPD